MTRKDYVLIADILARVRRGIANKSDGTHLAQFDFSFVPNICAELAAANPRFDAARFTRACGIPAD